MIEKVRIIPTGGKADQLKVYIPEEIISDPVGMGEYLGVDIRPKVDMRENTVELSLDYGQYWMKLKSAENNGQKCYQVVNLSINLARVLYGHNGRIILTDAEFHQALLIANNTLNKIVTEDCMDLLIPGLVAESSSYFSYLEIANHIHDPNAEIIRKMRHARLKGYDSDSLTYDDMKTSGTSESIYLGNSKNPIVSCYRKDLEMQKDRPGDKGKRWIVLDEDKNTIRLEIRLKARKLTNALLGSGSYENQMRIKSFCIADIEKLYAKVLDQIRGVFHDSSYNYKGPDKFKEATQLMIAKIDANPSMKLFELLRDLQSEKNYCDVSINIVRRNLEDYLESQSTMTLSEFLPSSVDCEPRHITPYKKDPFGNIVPVFRQQPIVEVDHRIVEAYSRLDTLSIDPFENILRLNPGPFTKKRR